MPKRVLKLCPFLNKQCIGDLCELFIVYTSFKTTTDLVETSFEVCCLKLRAYNHDYLGNRPRKEVIEELE